jgi:hypothetical protein
MDRSKYPVSVVPYPIDMATSARRPATVDENSVWDAKWLRPNVTRMPLPVANERLASPAEQKPGAQQAQKPAIQQQRPAIQERVEVEETISLPVYLRVLRWLFPEVNQRRAARYPTPNLVAYYWTGGAPYSYQVGDMSATGLFLLTKDRWAPGTLIQMTLQAQTGRMASENSICVLSEVVRWGENGSGFNFVLKDYENVNDYGMAPSETIDRKSVEKFLRNAGVPTGR